MRYWVLIVDDHKEVRRMLRAGVETLGENIQVVDVPSGEEAILLLSRQPIDLLVADVRLPGISGLEFIHRAGALNPKLKRILITGMTDPQIRQEVTEAGADSYFFKPINMNEFLAAAAGCLGIPLIDLTSSSASDPAIAEDAHPALQDGQRRDLGHLQSELSALAVVRLSASGDLSVLAGSLPGKIQADLFAQSALSFLAARQNMTAHLGQEASPGLFYLPGARFDLAGADLGPQGAWLAVLPPGTGDENLHRVMQILQKEGQTFYPQEDSALEQTHPSREPVDSGVSDWTLSAEPQDIDQSLPALDDVFAKAVHQTLDHADVNAFWDSLADSDLGEDSGKAQFKGSLSYEEARRMGLTPEDH